MEQGGQNLSKKLLNPGAKIFQPSSLKLTHCSTDSFSLNPYASESSFIDPNEKLASQSCNESLNESHEPIYPKSILGTTLCMFNDPKPVENVNQGISTLDPNTHPFVPSEYTTQINSDKELPNTSTLNPNACPFSIMCGSNWPRPTTPRGKTGDIT